MKTSDWALVISLCSFAVAVSSFVWNVWSKFIYPKPKVQVTFRASYIFQPGAPYHGREFFTLSATNFGPGDITLHSAVVRHYRKQWWKNWRAFFNRHYRRQYATVNPLEDFPHRFDHSIGPFSGGLPKKIATGESFNSYFPRGVDWFEQKRFRIGFSDSFDRNHWCSARDIRKVIADTRADKTERPPGEI
jgi:hypothetical protein